MFHSRNALLIVFLGIGKSSPGSIFIINKFNQLSVEHLFKMKIRRRFLLAVTYQLGESTRLSSVLVSGFRQWSFSIIATCEECLKENKK